MANKVFVDNANEGLLPTCFLLVLCSLSTCLLMPISYVHHLLTDQFMFRFCTSWTTTVTRCCPWAPWSRCPRRRSASSSAETPSRRTSSSSSKSVHSRPVGDVWRGLDSSYSFWRIGSRLQAKAAKKPTKHSHLNSLVMNHSSIRWLMVSSERWSVSRGFVEHCLQVWGLVWSNHHQQHR